MGSFFLYNRFLVFAFMVLALGSVEAWGVSCSSESWQNAGICSCPEGSFSVNCNDGSLACGETALNAKAQCPRGQEASLEPTQVPATPAQEAAKKPAVDANTVNAAIKKCSTDFEKSVGKGNASESKNYGHGSGSCDAQTNDGVGLINGEIAKFGIAMASAVSMKDACGQLASIMPTANASLAAFNMMCRGVIDMCVTSCQAAVTQKNAAITAGGVIPGLNADDPNEPVEKKLSACKDFTTKMTVNTGALVQTMLGNNKTAAACNLVVQQTTNGGASVITGDCTNPANAANPVCKGMNPGAAAKSLGPSGVGAGVGVGSAAPGAAISGLGSGNGFGPEPMAAKKDAGGGGPSGGGGGGGGGIGGGGGLGGGAKKKGSAAAAEPRDTKMYGGLIQGGGGPMGGTASTDPSASGSSRSGSSALPGSPEAGKGPDLSKYAPNMKYDPSRNLAGVTGPDGITGPNSNLFDKVKGQYGTQSDHGHLFAPAP